MTEQNPSVQRPLSPHLQVYRLPLLPLMSISHRVTGVGLAFGTLVLAWWLAALATGPGAYAVFTAFMMPLGGLALLGWMIAIAYHFCNGIRHLIWDTGHSLDLESAEKAGIAVLIGWVILSVAMVALALFFWLT
jgi:succinate dehydrogenase / fumarate reductase cytochrome b subunit